MGHFAQATAAMPLPPAQAEAIYDLLLDDEGADAFADEPIAGYKADASVEPVRQSALVLITGPSEAKRGQGR